MHTGTRSAHIECKQKVQERGNAPQAVSNHQLMGKELVDKYTSFPPLS